MNNKMATNTLYQQLNPKNKANKNRDRIMDTECFDVARLKWGVGERGKR